MITQDELKRLVKYNPETGIMTGCGGSKADRGGYHRILVRGIRYRVHRLAWLYMTGEMPTNMIDHIDQNPSNNRFSNLREADYCLNAQNKSLPSSNTSGCKGVSFQTKANKWTAVINCNRVHKYLGMFKNKEDAIKARKKAEVEMGYNK